MTTDLAKNDEAAGLGGSDLDKFVPSELRDLGNAQTAIPKIVRDPRLTALIESAIQGIPTSHSIFLADSRIQPAIPSNSVHLVLTSPPYLTLKEYRDSEGQMGHIENYELFLNELDEVWQRCFDALVPGGRLVCVVGDVCLSRRKNGGRHTVVPLHASIQERCRKVGFDNLAPIIWHKIANAAYEVEGAGGFLGKPYEPNCVIKNDIEFILMQRKPGGYRTPSLAESVLSVISYDNHKKWFQQIWQGVTGASTRNHPAPYPVELAERLVRIFSFVGYTVLDPFMGTGTSNLAAMNWGRNSIGIEVDPEYFKMASKRLNSQSAHQFRTSVVQTSEHPSDGANGRRKKRS
jgi:DNA modification methylase